MSGIRLAICFVVILAISAPSIANAAERYQKDGFSISLPEDWVEIPRDVIDEYEARLAEALPDAEPQHYDYAFQPSSSVNWFEYPYVLIQVIDKGRIPESKLENMDKYALQASLDEQKEKLSPIITKMQLGKVYYDKGSNIIWMRMQCDAGNSDQIALLAGFTPTEKGMISVDCYSMIGDLPSYETTFQTIAKSVVPVPELVYAPNWSDNSPSFLTRISLEELAGMVVGFAIFGVITFILIIRRKKQK